MRINKKNLMTIIEHYLSEGKEKEEEKTPSSAEEAIELLKQGDEINLKNLIDKLPLKGKIDSEQTYSSKTIPKAVYTALMSVLPSNNNKNVS